MYYSRDGPKEPVLKEECAIIQRTKTSVVEKHLNNSQTLDSDVKFTLEEANSKETFRMRENKYVGKRKKLVRNRSTAKEVPVMMQNYTSSRDKTRLEKPKQKLNIKPKSNNYRKLHFQA